MVHSLTSPGDRRYTRFPASLEQDPASKGDVVTNADRSREDDWFRQNERELLEAARIARLKRQQEREAGEKEEERRRLRELHYLKCPKCGHDMKAQELSGVEVDRCSHCEGVFFDAGEFESIFTKRAEERHSFWRGLLRI
jgi:uncharacterized protein